MTPPRRGRHPQGPPEEQAEERSIVLNAMLAAQDPAKPDVDRDTTPHVPRTRRAQRQIDDEPRSPADVQRDIREAYAVLAQAITHELNRRDPTGALVTALDVEDFARRVVDQIDTAPLWSQHLGPVYSQTTVQELLDLSAETLVQRDDLLQMTTGDGTVVYPAFQFEGNEQLAGVADIVRAARGRVSRWTLASWFRTANENLAGATPLAVIRAGAAASAEAAAELWLEGLEG